MLLRSSPFRAAFGNPTLRRIGSAYALFVSAEFGVWITLLVFAYGRGGASASTWRVLIQLLPCIVLSPFIGAKGRPNGVLRVGYGLQAISMAAVAAAIGLNAPTFVVFVLAPLTAISLTLTGSPEAAVLPAIIRTPDELTGRRASLTLRHPGSPRPGPVRSPRSQASRQTRRLLGGSFDARLKKMGAPTERPSRPATAVMTVSRPVGGPASIARRLMFSAVRCCELLVRFLLLQISYGESLNLGPD